jgi:hypothetical protein
MNTLELALTLAILLIRATGSAGMAAALIPPLPSSFYGTVAVDGAGVPAGTRVSAWIHGVKYAEAPAFLFEDQSFYALSVPADGPATSEVEGGRPGDTIVFHIGGLKADQTGVWRGGTNTRQDLTATSVRLFLPLVSHIGARWCANKVDSAHGMES